MKKIFISLSIASLLAGFGTTQKQTVPRRDKGLKDYYKDYFPIGVAVNTHNIKGAEGNLILKEFNSITPENAMKWAPIHPFQNVYHWKDADS
ncbi:MAG: endo-1,4-beta-xylanase, partial [Chitinophagales bacterium]